MSLESVIDSLQLSRPDYTNREHFLHRCRIELEPFVYSYLRETYGAALNRHWDSCTIPLVSSKAILIVERRCHPNLEFTIQNAVYFARGYSVHIICSKANLSFVQEICGSQTVHIHPVFTTIGTPEVGKREYNALLKSYGFWASFPEEYFLCMETDSYLVRPVPKSLADYHYVASRWHWVPGQAGGGGISHRRRSFMLEICVLPSLQAIEMQDTFAAQGLLELGYPVLEKEVFCESSCHPDLIGTHQWWTFVCENASDRDDFISVMLTLEIDGGGEAP